MKPGDLIKTPSTPELDHLGPYGFEDQLGIIIDNYEEPGVVKEGEFVRVLLGGKIYVLATGLLKFNL